VQPELDRRTVERVARAALEAPEAVVLDYRVTPLAYDSYLPGRSVVRVEGRARIDEAERAWSAIRKSTESPGRIQKAPSERAHREALAYQSGLLREANGLGAPRAFLIEVRDDRSVPASS
jgi:hypothetical protein